MWQVDYQMLAFDPLGVAKRLSEYLPAIGRIYPQRRPGRGTVHSRQFPSDRSKSLADYADTKPEAAVNTEQLLPISFLPG